jgi:hypothetical protein
MFSLVIGACFLTRSFQSWKSELSSGERRFADILMGNNFRQLLAAPIVEDLHHLVRVMDGSTRRKEEGHHHRHADRLHSRLPRAVRRCPRPLPAHPRRHLL